jgi:hypothetical protein
VLVLRQDELPVLQGARQDEPRELPDGIPTGEPIQRAEVGYYAPALRDGLPGLGG